jgi:DNA-binding GntR family transcriptional regulator
MTGKVYAALRRDILSCQIVPGQDLSEGELATRFKMSKTPVREALSKLRSEGLVKAFPRRGYQVAPVTFQDMNELFEVRNMLEGRATELASQNITEDGLRQLSNLADVMYDPSEQLSIRRFVQANRDFHEIIASFSGNVRLQSMVMQVLDELQRFFHLGAQLRDIGTETTDYHHHIVAALKDGDGALSRQVMIAHNDASKEGLMAALTQQSRSIMQI